MPPHVQNILLTDITPLNVCPILSHFQSFIPSLPPPGESLQSPAYYSWLRGKELSCLPQLLGARSWSDVTGTKTGNYGNRNDQNCYLYVIFQIKSLQGIPYRTHPGPMRWWRSVRRDMTNQWRVRRSSKTEGDMNISEVLGRKEVAETRFRSQQSVCESTAVRMHKKTSALKVSQAV